MASWKVLNLFLLTYAIFAIGYIHVTPFRQTGCLSGGARLQQFPDIGAPDEWQHTNYIRHLVRERSFPIFKPGSADIYDTYQSHQPPLYYLLAAPFEMISARNEAIEKWALRLMNVILGALVIIGIYTGIRRFTGNEHAALFGAGFTALLPMFLAVSGAVSNDMLLFLAAVALMNVIAMGWQTRWGVRECLLAGLVIGLGVLTKTTAVLLVPVLLAGFWLNKPSRPRLAHAALALALALLVALPWLLRNQSLYGDPLAIGAFRQASVGNLDTAKAIENAGGPLPYWYTVFSLAFHGFWGVFGYFYISFPTVVYRLLGAMSVAFLVGLIVRLRQADSNERMVHGLCFVLLTCVLAGFISYNMSYFQAQGRYILPAIFGFASFAGFSVVGFSRIGQPSEHGAQRRFWMIGGTFLAFLFALNLYAVYWLLPIAFAVIESCR